MAGELLELMELAGKATAGEWDYYAQRVFSGNFMVGACNHISNGYEDAAFIAAACNYIRSAEFARLVADAGRWHYLRDTKQFAADVYWRLGDSDATHEQRTDAVDAARRGGGE